MTNTESSAFRELYENSLITSANMATVIGIYSGRLEAIRWELERSGVPIDKEAMLAEVKRSVKIAEFVWENRSERLWNYETAKNAAYGIVQTEN